MNDDERDDYREDNANGRIVRKQDMAIVKDDKDSRLNRLVINQPGGCKGWTQNLRVLVEIDKIQKQTPLGDRYFMKVAGQCIPSDDPSGAYVDRYTVMDNTTRGEIKYPAINIQSVKDGGFEYGDEVTYSGSDGKWSEHTFKVIGKEGGMLFGSGSNYQIQSIKDPSVTIGFESDSQKMKYEETVDEGELSYVTFSIKNATGTVPSTLESAKRVLDSRPLFRAFFQDQIPECTNIKIKTQYDQTAKNAPANCSDNEHYVANDEVANIDPCSFSNGKNPLTGESCKNHTNCNEGFQNMIDNCKRCDGTFDINSKRKKYLNYKNFMEEDDDSSTMENLYLLLIGIFGLYIVKKIIDKN